MTFETKRIQNGDYNMNKAPSMDKDSMVEVKNRFKKMSVVPDENCFANAILNLKEHQKPAIVIRNTSFCDVRFFYLIKLRLARSCIQVFTYAYGKG
ncbi:uncharacterized protein LOC108817615 isoform X2 [Raphanus sativus]|uniref:Uncharacterized protein LOC108817615 isoform X2 n=1 Tax=Raphanus sativus TaxID=3726 RepID=A0A9W3DME0_RAPSA|nr:uncharacterized protein LOC108817615 isoform X2 [Raphanus sativus]